MLPSPMDLPPLEKGVEKESEGVTQMGSERNPEFLPPIAPGVGAVKPDPAQDPAPQIPHNQIPDPAAVPAPDPNPQAPLAHDAPQIADDIDLIEKEWVEKAKEIVSKTKENPYLQNKAISEIKADYIKKRYNKEIAKSKE